MKHVHILLSGCLVLLLGCDARSSGKLTVTDLRCEYLINPLGIGTVTPALSWELLSSARSVKQTAYQILVADDSLALTKDQGNLWDSGMVTSDRQNQVIYGGTPLESRRFCFWKVKVWFEDGKQSSWSPIASWSIGLLNAGDWTADWIGAEKILSPGEDEKYTIPASPLLRKDFSIEKKVVRATLYASALGVYEIYLNGNKLGNHILAPEWTDYFNRVQYQTYDATPYLQSSDNTLSAILADGWYVGRLFTHADPVRGNYGFDRRLIAQLEITFSDGTRETIVSDGDWKMLDEGPIRMASIFDGETYDRTYDPENWMQPAFDDGTWKSVTVDRDVSISLSPQMNEPIITVKEIEPISITPVGQDAYIIDLGQNIAGWVRLSLPYNPKDTIKLRFGEVLDDDGQLYTENLRSAQQTNIYVPGNESTITYEPRFTYFGFRYVEVSGLTRTPAVEDITGIVVSSSSRIVSEFESSNEDINKLWSNILWTQVGNMHGVPTDCPQRDERAGWMGDAQAFSQTAMFNMDMAAFFKKWFQDIRDNQQPEGRYPNYAPQVGLVFFDAPAWADGGVIIPWKYYLNYGDTSVISDHYESMKRFIDYVHVQNPDLIRVNGVGQNYGDWLNGDAIRSDDYPRGKGATPKDLFATAFFAYSTYLFSEMAEILGKSTDAAQYRDLANRIKQVFVNEFVGPDGKLKGDSQGGYAIALEFDLIPAQLREKAAAHMVRVIKEYDYRISTGIHTTIRLMNQLSAFGYTDIAYRLIESKRFPSWLYSIGQGATTIWERWDGYVKGRGFQSKGMNSFNHYALGSVGEWMYRNILGINLDESAPGYQHVIIRPIPGGSISWAKGNHHSIAGAIGVSWTNDAHGFRVDVDIPANMSATVVLPPGENVTEGRQPIASVRGVHSIVHDETGTRVEVGSGKYQFHTNLL